MDSSWDDADVLQTLAHELSFRSSSACVRLEQAIRARLCALGNGVEFTDPSGSTHLQPPLTDAQREIARLPWGAKALVIAGPGTGKTHVVVHRIQDLTDRQGLMPGSDLLVLSFSRAAVSEIRKRLRAFGGSASYARAATFDSFATQLLSAINPSGGWSEGTFDDRILAATEAISKSHAGIVERVNSIRHVIVDEMQDLVGVRAEFVKSILEGSRGGFTLLGDPAQGIYTFQLPEPERHIGGHTIALWARNAYGDSLVIKSLQENIRAQNSAALVASPCGPMLNAERPAYPEIYSQLTTILRALPNIGSAGKALQRVSQDKRVAILCRNNGQALQISRSMFESNVTHRLQRRAVDRAIPRWIADLVSILQSAACSKSAALHVLAQVEDCRQHPEVCWTTLKRLEGASSANTLDFAKVADAMRSGRVPDELIDIANDSVVISSIHRAKGLEFDDVFLFESDIWGEITPGAIAEEARIIYVALTRARCRFWRIEPPNCSWIKKETEADARWFERGYESWQTFGIEMTASDVESSVPHGAQEYLRNHVSRNSAVTLVTAGYSKDEHGCLGFYKVLHGSTEIGRTSYSFAVALNRVLRRNGVIPKRWPSRIDGVHIECVESVAGSQGKARSLGIGPVDIWLRPRLFGLGKLIWE
jgi:hypothetical protein